ncbi:LacI family transcriptional regulator [Vibrio sp. HA2012]|uniref:LacI family DNA-binding transcriptional regulator n=1 Tax=Vibrio sp. HA2012 TaxID=1971595 RepID=UPI000C2CB9F4|nr:LacI family DNA-binding transcriptional regulator [Vibrio sp. HA2012]PJC87076.1 LacI family transcriptional regulator [Vibrio sp. HA2012]
MARIKDVAELVGVNRSTVSRIINGEGKFREDTVRKVHEAMAQLNYRPSAVARSLATSSTNMIGLLVTYYTGGFFGEMMEQIQSELDLHKKFLITAQGHQCLEGEKEAIQRFRDLRCDGYVLHSRYLTDDELRSLATQPTPFVLLDRYVEGLEERCITFDHCKASYLAVQHLITQGHKKIGCLTGPVNRNNARERVKGYLNATADAGLPMDISWSEAGDYGRRSGYKAMDILLKRHPDISGLFSCSEEMTSGALQYLHENNIKVPDQISIISFDSVDLCESLYPSVSAVHFPISDMARSAVQVLTGLISNQPCPGIRQFESELRLRDSSVTL